MKLNDREDSVEGAEQESDHSQVTAIVEQWQKSRVQSAKWTDAKNHMQKQKCRRASGSDEHRLGGGVWKKEGGRADEQGDVSKRASDDYQVI
jgi:hypothetical protein